MMFYKVTGEGAPGGICDIRGRHLIGYDIQTLGMKYRAKDGI